MKALVEWAFRFVVRSTMDEITHKDAEGVLCRACSWAADNGYGVGGGFEQVAGGWKFEFGLTATEDDQLILESGASELLQLLKEVCAARGYQLGGGFREYTKDELELPACLRAALRDGRRKGSVKSSGRRRRTGSP